MKKCGIAQIYVFTNTLQTLFYLHIPHPIHVLCRTAIQDGFSCNRPVPVLGHGALSRVDQMAGLLRDDLGTVLDFKDLAGRGGRVKDHHIEFADGELQDEHLLFRICQHGFQQHDNESLPHSLRQICKHF